MTTKKNKFNILSLIVSGFCIGLAFPPLDLFFLLFPGFAILIYNIFTAEKLSEVFKRSYVILFSAMLIAVSWLPMSGMRENADRFLIVGGLLTMILYPVTYMIPVLSFYFIKNQLKKLFPDNILIPFLLFPPVWISFEYLMTATEISFPWLTVGNAFTTQLNKIQFADITGVFGISAWSLYISVFLCLLFISARKEQGFNFRNISYALIIIILYISPDFYTTFSRSESKYTADYNRDTVKIGILQPNINPWKKWGAKQGDLVKDYLNSLNELSFRNPKPDLIVMPETAMPFYFLHPSYDERFQMFKKLIDSSGVPVLIGSPDLETYTNPEDVRIDSKVFSDGKRYDVFNSSSLLQRNSTRENIQKYDKIKLVIGSERMPYQEKLKFLQNLIKWSVGISSYQIGNDTLIFKTDSGLNFNGVICYESIYPEFFAKFIEKGAQFCVVITNDGWWGKLQGTYQHNQFAVLRAIENRRWIARCANTGISGVFDPFGNKYDQTEINEKALFVSKIGQRTELTFYTLHGDYIGKFSFGIWLGFLLVGVVIKFLKKKKQS